MSRAPSPHPELPGFTYLRALGTGGFADVFLYEQQLPRRQVAVKVLLTERITTGAAQEFTDEANVMAMLSTHPAIVTIYQAGVAGDGRPYLVMEYCPRPNLQARARKDPFSVAEALRVGIQVAGAVETAHRAGVLHRDIKPANILVTEYNRPALTDFGIASTTGTVDEAAGMSIPWSPPESFATPPRSGVRSDVYQLGATVFTLLVGRSPFERPGERNTSADLIERIERMATPPLNRPDAPTSLDAVLARALAKNPEDRYPSAVAFARALQKVQIELSHSVTPIDIVDDQPAADDADQDDDDGLTRVRSVQSIDPATSSETRPSARTERKRETPISDAPRFERAPSAAAEETVLRSPTPAAADDDETLLSPPRVVAPVLPQPAAPAGASEAPAPARSPRRWWGWAAAAVVVALIGTYFWFSDDITHALFPSPTPTISEETRPVDVVSTIVPPVTELVGTRDGDAVSFSWKNPDPHGGDTYIWQQVTLDGLEPAKNVDEPSVTLQGAHPERTCIEVSLVRSDRRSSDPVRGCVD